MIVWRLLKTKSFFIKHLYGIIFYDLSVTGIKYWKVTEKGLASGYPKDIVSTWPRLPGYIDAAFTLTKNKTYFFKNNKYWRYTGTTLDEEYPKYISSGFKGIPDNIDSALVLNESGTPKIYFFKG